MEESRIVCCLKFYQTEELELPFLREKGADFTMDQTISKTESAILHTYNRYDLVLEKETALTCMIQMESLFGFWLGDWCQFSWIWKQNIAVCIEKQIDQLIHTSNYIITNRLPKRQKN